MIAALEFAKMGKSMTAGLMNKLADTYMIYEGYVDYLACFRNYLNELIAIMPSNTNEFRAKTGHQAKTKLGRNPDVCFNVVLLLFIVYVINSLNI